MLASAYECLFFLQLLILHLPQSIPRLVGETLGKLSSRSFFFCYLVVAIRGNWFSSQLSASVYWYKHTVATYRCKILMLWKYISHAYLVTTTRKEHDRKKRTIVEIALIYRTTLSSYYMVLSWALNLNRHNLCSLGVYELKHK